MIAAELAAVASGAGIAASALVKRSVLRHDRIDHLSFSVVYHLGSVIALLPLLLFYTITPTNPVGWLFALASALLWGTLGVVGFYNIKKIEAGRLTVLKRFKIVAVIAFSTLLLGEALTFNKLAAAGLILSSTLLLSYEKGLKFDKDALIAIGTTLLSAAVVITDKAALDYFTLPGFAFLMYLLPGTAILLYSAKGFDYHVKNLSGMKKWLLLDIAIDACVYFLMLAALQNSTAITVALLQELSLPITTIGGVILLKEKKDLKKVAAATALALTGAILLII